MQAHLIYERLDRAVMRDDWVSVYLESIIKHETFSCYDHSPIILSITNPIRRRKNLPFRFQNHWCRYRQGKQRQAQVQGTKIFKLTQKLKRTKQHIKVWA